MRKMRWTHGVRSAATMDKYREIESHINRAFQHLEVALREIQQLRVLEEEKRDKKKVEHVRW